MLIRFNHLPLRVLLLEKRRRVCPAAWGFKIRDEKIRTHIEVYGDHAGDVLCVRVWELDVYGLQDCAGELQ
jgi:hypothetical protein